MWLYGGVAALRCECNHSLWLTTWHNSCNAHRNWNMMIQPRNKHWGAVGGKDYDFFTTTAVFQSRSSKLSGPLTHTGCNLSRFPHLPFSSFCNSVHALISFYLSMLATTCFAHTGLRRCPVWPCNTWQQVPLWHLFCKYAILPTSKTYLNKKNTLRQQGWRATWHLKMSGSNISLSVVMVGYFPLHDAQNPPSHKQYIFTGWGSTSFFESQKPRRESAVTKYLERHFPPQLKKKEALRWGADKYFIVGEAGETN